MKKHLSLSRQPQGVTLVFLLQILGMIGFSMIYSLVVLYATNKLGMGQNHAYAISAAFNALAFALSVPTGYIAQRFMGYFWGTWLAAVLSGVGLALIMFSSTKALYTGLAIYTVGNSMFVACLYVLLGRLYQEGHSSASRESGFMWSYIGMNIGAFFASGASGSISTDWSYELAFGIGAAASFLCVPLLFYYHRIFNQDDDCIIPLADKLMGVFWIMLVTLLTIVLVYYAETCNALMIVLGLIAGIWVLLIAKRYHGITRYKIMAFLALTIVSVIFWALYCLTPAAITIFTQYNVNRDVLNQLIPAADFSGLNPFFIVTLGPIVSFLFVRLSVLKIQFDLASKFTVGLVLMALGYGVLTLGIHFANQAGMITLIWLVLSYFFQTLGELFVGPVGYAMVGQLVPRETEGLMMGIWQLATGVAGALSEYLSDYTSTPSAQNIPKLTDPGFGHAFLVFSLVTLGAAAVTACMIPTLRKITTRP